MYIVIIKINNRHYFLEYKLLNRIYKYALKIDFKFNYRSESCIDVRKKLYKCLFKNNTSLK